MTTNNTPPNAYDELRDNISSIVYGADWKTKLGEDAHLPQTEAIMEIIKKHELQAIQRVFDKVDRSTDFQEWNGTGIMFRDELLAELKQELEEL